MTARVDGMGKREAPITTQVDKKGNGEGGGGGGENTGQT